MWGIINYKTAPLKQEQFFKIYIICPKLFFYAGFSVAVVFRFYSINFHIPFQIYLKQASSF